MYKLSDLIGDYEEPETIVVQDMKQFPIQSPQGLDWKNLENPNRLSKMFRFGTEEKLNAFVLDVLEHQSETGHHGRITIQNPQVKIEVWTHTLNDVTEVDVEWAKSVNDIYDGYR